MVPHTNDVGAARYVLDAATASFFGSQNFYLMWLKGRLYGRFGRSGSLRGVLYGRMLSATWVAGARSGWLTARFDLGLASLNGFYGLKADRANPLASWSGHSTSESER